MSTTTRPRGGASRPPPWRNVRVLQWVFQIAVLAVVVGLVLVLVGNVRENSRSLGIPTGYDYLDNPAGFPIPDSNFRQRQPVSDALVIGLVNTLRVSLIGIVVATVLGTFIGVARLSRNWLLRNAARVYVEVIRNLPLLLILTFCYAGLALVAFPRIADAWEPGGLVVISNRGVVLPWHDEGGWGLLAVLAVAAVAAVVAYRLRRRAADRTGAPARSGLWAVAAFVVVAAVGWAAVGIGTTVPERDGNSVTGGVRLSPEFFAILFALVIYTASHIAEIVRGSIQAVAKGQGEAADALALSGFQRLWYVVLPQAFRIAVPPLGNQYLNLTKNSTLGATVSYFELAQVTSIAVANGAPAVPSYLLTLGIFVVLSLVLSFAVNVANRRLALVER
jgi:general L-amino acid transport system permease protein